MSDLIVMGSVLIFMGICMCSSLSFSTASSLNQGQSHVFHLDPHIMQNSAPQRLQKKKR